MIIDISYYNIVTNWRRVAESVEGVIIRLGYTGYGSGKVTYDKRYDDHMAGAKRYEIPRGIYYFPASVTRAEAEAEAEAAAAGKKSTAKKQLTPEEEAQQIKVLQQIYNSIGHWW